MPPTSQLQRHKVKQGAIFLVLLTINGKPIRLNDPIHLLCTVLKLLASSEEKAELEAHFLNVREVKIIKITL